jgi:hypothetical protein
MSLTVMDGPQSILFLIAVIVTIIASFAPIASYSPDFGNTSPRLEQLDPKIIVGTSSMNFDQQYVKSIHGTKERYDKEMQEADEMMERELESRGISIVFTLGLIGSLLLAACIVLLTFLYKNRKLQIRLGIGLTLISLAITTGVFIGSKIGMKVFAQLEIIPSRIADAKWDITYNYGFFMFPLIAVCLLVGVLLVRRDDNLVKSLDRLR